MQVHVRGYREGDAEGMVGLKRPIAEKTGALLHEPGFYVYHPAFAGGANIRCAEDEKGRLVGFATAFAYPTPERPELPRQVWVDVRASLEAPEPDAVRDALLAAILARLREVAQEDGGHALSPYAGGFAEETESIAYYRSRGFAEGWCMHQLRRDLTQPLTEAPLPAGVEVRHSRLETEAEREAYLRLHNECFPDFPESEAGLMAILEAPYWKTGTALLARAGDELVGSVLAYWLEEADQPRGDGVGTVENVFVSPSWRRRGLARHMVTEALRYLRDHEFTTAGIEVRTDNVAAYATYRSVGYERVREVVILTYKDVLHAE
jgi:ribosomal protein S18 acetylase RimI-like enzyme